MLTCRVGPLSAAHEMTGARLDGDAYSRSSMPVERRSSAPGGRSVVSANDVLDDHRMGYEDAASYGGYSMGQYNNYSQAPPQGPSRQMSQQYPPQGPPHQQYAGYR